MLVKPSWYTVVQQQKNVIVAWNILMQGSPVAEEILNKKFLKIYWYTIATNAADDWKRSLKDPDTTWSINLPLFVLTSKNNINSSLLNGQNNLFLRRNRSDIIFGRTGIVYVQSGLSMTAMSTSSSSLSKFCTSAACHPKDQNVA
jgi:hypothetical protein